MPSIRANPRLISSGGPYNAPVLWALRKLAGKLRRPAPPAPPRPLSADAAFARRKAAKLARIRPLLDPALPCRETPLALDFLSDELRRQFDIVDTANVSSNNYDETAKRLIAENAGGLVLDCGAGSRAVYFDDVVNFEIAPYESTDVRGVGERLPFRDNAFDAAFSFAVLEHVKDPFACAKELTRVLKPGGTLYAVVPFLQPYHGYPHHYYNMSHQGLRNLFAPGLEVVEQTVIPSGLPVWTLSWFLSSWAAGLPFGARMRFLNMRVGDLLGPAERYMNASFVTALPADKNFELASTTALIARKPG